MMSNNKMNTNAMMNNAMMNKEKRDDGANENESCDRDQGPNQYSSETLSEQLSSGAKKPSTSQHPHLFHLTGWAGNGFEGGSLVGASEENFKILKGQQASVYIARLEPNAVREPHWHPVAWEVNFVISGRVRWSFVGPRASHDVFEAEKGDLVFVPAGHLHYFENASDTEDLVVFIVFNTSVSEPDDDIGIVASLSGLPADVLAACFKTSPDAFRNLPHKMEPVVITRKQQPK
jgi:oxalate decarboxylase